MKEVAVKEPVVQVLICTNDREPGKPSCRPVGGQTLLDMFKTKVKEENLKSKVQVTRSGCLGYCNNIGCTLTLRYEGQKTFYISEVKEEDFPVIWEKIKSAL